MSSNRTVSSDPLQDMVSAVGITTSPPTPTNPGSSTPGWTYQDSAPYTEGGAGFTNGVFTLTYAGDFDTPRAEQWEILLEGLSLGTLSNGDASDDRFIENSGWGDVTRDNFPFFNGPNVYTVSAALTDAELAQILSDNSIGVTFQDQTPPGDRIAWISRVSWTLSFDDTSTPVFLGSLSDGAETVSFDENSSDGTTVFDVDAGIGQGAADQNVSYDIIAGNLSQDGDLNLPFQIDPTTGTITVNDSGDLDFETTPVFNLTVEAQNASTLSTSTAQVMVSLADVNDPPIAQPDFVQTNEDTAVLGNVLINNGNGADSDADGDPITVVAVNGQAANVGAQIALTGGGLLTVNSDGTFTFDPNSEFDFLRPFFGIFDQSFTYTISDGQGGQASATATVRITGVDDPSIISGDLTGTVTEDAPVNTVSGQIIITDVDSTPGIFGNGTLAGTYGSFTYNSAGAWTYTLDNADPDTDLLGTGQTVQDTFSLFTAGLTPFNVTIDINGADEPPGATPWSDLFQVNVMDAGPSGDDQFEPVSIQLKNGDIVVLWVDLSGAAPGDAPSRDIVGQVFDPLGNRIGSEFLANAGFSDRNEGDFSAAALDNGGFVVTYVDVGTFPGVTNVIHATEWATNADGTVGASQARTIFASTDPTVRATSEQHVTSQPGGGYVVTFLTGNLTTLEVTANIVAVDSDGSAAAPVSLPLSRIFELGLDFASASMPNGNLAVLLQSQGNSADTIDLWIGTTDGITIAQSTIVTLGAVALRESPSITALSGGELVVAWTENSGVSDILVKAQVLSSTGEPIGDPIDVDADSATILDQQPHVFALADGGFGIAFTEGTTGGSSFENIVVERYDATGNLIGQRVQIDGNEARKPQVVGLEDGRFFIAFEDSVRDLIAQTRNDDVFAQIFDPRVAVNGRFYGPEGWQIGTTDDDVFTAAASAKFVHGHDGNDTITQQSQTNSLFGDAGDDRITATNPATGVSPTGTYDGGTGTDTFRAEFVAFVLVDLLSGTAGNGFFSRALLNFENVDQSGWFFDSDIRGDDAANALTGGEGNDTISGNGGNDAINGGPGEDTIFGNAGNDLIIDGDAGLQESDGKDSIDAGSGNDIVRANFIRDEEVFDGGADIDLIDFSADTFDPSNFVAAATIDLASETVVLVSPSLITLSTTTIRNFENVSGSQGSETINGDDGANELSGNAGSDTINGAGGNDTLNGGADGDELNGGAGRDSILGDSGNDSLTGGNDRDTLEGGEGNDQLNGDRGRDSLDGGIGMDTLDGGSDSDVLNGGANDDTLNGGAGNDELNGGAGADVLSGESGNDTLDGGTEADNLAGGTGRDSLVGGMGNDTLSGNNGSDVLEGGEGDDKLSGGRDRDTLEGGEGNDEINGDRGRDSLDGGIGMDTLDGGSDSDVLNGGANDDTLDGGAGNDELNGGAGADVLSGESGNDTLDGGTEADNLAGGTGRDSLVGGMGNDTLSGNNGSDTLEGGEGNDTLNGGADRDTLDGGEGNDKLTGGNGVDTLEGGAGNDSLTGGLANDIFVFTDGFGRDRITDFDAGSADEKIDLSGVTAITNFGDLAANHMSQSGANVLIEDGAGNRIQINNTLLGDLDAGDFVFN